MIRRLLLFSILLTILSLSISAAKLAAERPSRQELRDVALTTGFWRAEFEKPLHFPRDTSGNTVDAPKRADSARVAESSPGQPDVNRLQAGPNLSAESGIASVIEPATIENSFEEPFTADVDVSANDRILSDWERAESLSAGANLVGKSKDGPSAVTAVVGLAGVVIVIGAYLRSGAR